MRIVGVARVDRSLWLVRVGVSVRIGCNDGVVFTTERLGHSIVPVSSSGAADVYDRPLTSAGSRDIFIAKYDGDGNFLWVVQAGGTCVDVGRAIATDGAGNSIATGTFLVMATSGDTTLFSAGFHDFFAVFCDDAGIFLSLL